MFKEMFGWITEKSRTVYLTDGGNIENLGVYPLLKRRCKVIIAIDAEADPAMSFDSFEKLQRYAFADLGVKVDLPPEGIRARNKEIDKAFKQADAEDAVIPCARGPHCAVGEIQYGPNETAVLIYVKASLSGDEKNYILDYKRRHPAFPHETTVDQVFSEEQFEVYRALGFHIMRGILTGESPFAVTPRPSEWEYQARLRILTEIRAAFFGIESGHPA